MKHQNTLIINYSSPLLPINSSPTWIYTLTATNFKKNPVSLTTFGLNLKIKKKNSIDKLSLTTFVVRRGSKTKEKKKFLLVNYHLPVLVRRGSKTKEKKKFLLVNYHLLAVEFNVVLKRGKKEIRIDNLSLNITRFDVDLKRQ
jgi:hypothetical protein